MRPGSRPARTTGSRSRGEALTIFTALPLVQITSLSAFTAALQLIIADGIKFGLVACRPGVSAPAAFLEGTAGVGVGEEDELGGFKIFAVSA